jgi:hypothetical protein
MTDTEIRQPSPLETDSRYMGLPEEHRRWIFEWTEGGTNLKRFEALWGVYGNNQPGLGKLKELIISCQEKAIELGNPDIVGPVTKEAKGDIK